MAKRRPSGDGMVRKREDGRWEGRIVVGHKSNGDSIFRYAETFMLIHAELSEGNLELTVTIPGLKRCRKVYQTKSGYWYFRTKSQEGYPVKQALYIGGFYTVEGITQYMEELHTDYCILRCDLAGFTV